MLSRFHLTAERNRHTYGITV